MTDVLSPLYTTECRNFTFDFEEFIKSELGLDLDKPKKKEGELQDLFNLNRLQ